MKTQEQSLDMSSAGSPAGGLALLQPRSPQAEPGGSSKQAGVNAIRPAPATPSTQRRTKLGHSTHTAESLTRPAGQPGDPKSRPGGAWHHPSWNSLSHSQQ